MTIRFRHCAAASLLLTVFSAMPVTAQDPGEGTGHGHSHHPFDGHNHGFTDEQKKQAAQDAIRTYGWFLAQQTAITMEFTEEELAIFLAGFNDGVTANLKDLRTHERRCPCNPANAGKSATQSVSSAMNKTNKSFNPY